MKAYWVSTYLEISNAAKFEDYGKLAGAAITAGGGVFLARGLAALAYERGLKERVVVIEFPSVEAAQSTYDGPAYREAVAILGDGAVRDIRIVAGV